MTGSGSLSSPLCTWLVAACMTVTCSKESKHALSPPSSTASNRSRRRKAATAAALKCNSNSKYNNYSSGMSGAGSSLQGLMSSCLAFEPCSHYYASNGLLRSNRKLRRLHPPALSGIFFTYSHLPFKSFSFLLFLFLPVMTTLLWCCLCLDFVLVIGFGLDLMLIYRFHLLLLGYLYNVCVSVCALSVL